MRLANKKPIFVLDAHLEFSSEVDSEDFMLHILHVCKEEGKIDWQTMSTKYSERTP